LRRIPWSGVLFVAGFFAITGAPGFGPFVSEIMILSAAFANRQIAAGCLFIALLFVVFTGMGASVLRFALGPRPATTAVEREPLGTRLPILFALALVLLLGFYTPSFLTDWIHETVGQPAGLAADLPPGDRAALDR
jgi:hydrogenase-4 component F